MLLRAGYRRTSLFIVVGLTVASACAPLVLSETNDALGTEDARAPDLSDAISPGPPTLEFSDQDCSVPLADGGEYVIDQSIANSDFAPSLDSSHTIGQVIIPAHSGVLTHIDVTLEALNGGQQFPLSLVLMNTIDGHPNVEITEMPIPIAYDGWAWYSVDFTSAHVHLEKNAMYAIQMRSAAPPGNWLGYACSPRVSCDVGPIWELRSGPADANLDWYPYIYGRPYEGVVFRAHIRPDDSFAAADE